MKREIWEVLKAIDDKKISIISAHNKICEIIQSEFNTDEEI